MASLAAAASATESKLLKRDTMLNDLEDLDPGTLNKVNDFVDDDLLSCFLWAAGENAVAQPGWESPSVNPLKGIPLPPARAERSGAERSGVERSGAERSGAATNQYTLSFPTWHS